MSAASSAQVLQPSRSMSAPPPQRIENTGFRSSQAMPRATAVSALTRRSGATEPADFAGRNAADAWRQRYADWMETPLPRASTDLLPRLPFNDAVKLAALVGTGRMTWPAVNAALDAMIKHAAANDLDGPRGARCLPLRQIAEDEIRARYHAQCDELFAADTHTADAPAPSREQLWRTERILDRMRSARDRELAALRRHICTQPPGQAAMPWTDLAPAESAALARLESTGFVASEGMIAAIDSLASEIAENIA